MLSTSEGKIRVLIVDASPAARQILVALVNSADDLLVIGEAASGIDAVRQNHALSPQVIAMNLHLPIMDGLQAAKLIMLERPTRIVMMGEPNEIQNAELISKITAVGALDFCARPIGFTDDLEGQQSHFIKTLRAMSQVGVVRLTRSSQQISSTLEMAALDFPGVRKQPEIVLIVSSTGGPNALEVILAGLPPAFPLPIVIVQHISSEFMDNMTAWLATISPLKIKMAENGERPQVGTIYIAPPSYHLRLTFNGRFALSDDGEDYRHVPSGDVLLESAAEVYGASAIGVILTGMGIDGAQGLARLREKGAHTIVQDEATSVVFGMPKAAIDRGASEYVVPLEHIAPLLMNLIQRGAEQT